MSEDFEHDDDQCFAVIAVGTPSGEWAVREFDDDFESIQNSIDVVKKQRAEGPCFAMLCVDDDYFVLVRPTPSGVKLLLSDVAMAVGDDLAASALDILGVDVPDMTDEEIEASEPYAEGDFDIFEDLGVSEQVMTVICDDTDAWTSELLLRIAAEVGCEEELADVVGLDLD